LSPRQARLPGGRAGVAGGSLWTCRRVIDEQHGREEGHGDPAAGRCGSDFGRLLPGQRPAILDAGRGDRVPVPRRASVEGGRSGRAGRGFRTAVRRPPPDRLSRASRGAFKIACRLAGGGGRVTVLHVPEPPHVPFGMAQAPPLPPGYRGAWMSKLELVRPADPSVSVDHRLEEGDPAGGILRVAGDSACDLIVMGASPGRRTATPSGGPARWPGMRSAR
jgi:nucleotide-binding universal stress UspA family protein